MVIIESVSRLLWECETFKELSLNSGMVELSPRIIQHIIKDLNGEDYESGKVHSKAFIFNCV